KPGTRARRALSHRLSGAVMAGRDTVAMTACSDNRLGNPPAIALACSLRCADGRLRCADDHFVPYFSITRLVASGRSETTCGWLHPAFLAGSPIRLAVVLRQLSQRTSLKRAPRPRSTKARLGSRNGTWGGGPLPADSAWRVTIGEARGSSFRN